MPALQPIYTSHTRVVRSLYRRALKTSRHWAFHHHLWRPMALAIRAEFDEKKKEESPNLIRKYIQEAENELEEWRHPDPYNQPHFFGGSKWERNLPPPEEVKRQSPFLKIQGSEARSMSAQNIRAL
jgi:NADH dehydrogenase (ubiquinone) 1 beta subcomplex subunit 9